MSEPTPYPQQPMSHQAMVDSHNFRARATPQGDLLDRIRDLEKRLSRLEAALNTR